MDWPLTVIGALFPAMMVLAVVLYLRHIAEIRATLRNWAKTIDFSEVRHYPLRAGIRATWRGFRVAIVRRSKYKSRPETVNTKVRVQGPSRLVVKKRGFQLFKKPVILFGPELVEPPGAEEFWVQADDGTLAATLFADRSFVSLLKANLIDEEDRLTLDGRSLEIIRATETSRATRELGKEVNVYDQYAIVRNVAGREWGAVSRAIEVLHLTPRD